MGGIQEKRANEEGEEKQEKKDEEKSAVKIEFELKKS